MSRRVHGGSHDRVGLHARGQADGLGLHSPRRVEHGGRAPRGPGDGPAVHPVAMDSMLPSLEPLRRWHSRSFRCRWPPQPTASPRRSRCRYPLGSHPDEEFPVTSPLKFWVFLPQMRLTMDQLVERARAAEAAGFGGMASMDHLAPPGAESSPMFEAMITSAWLAGRTDRLASARWCCATRFGIPLCSPAKPSPSITRRADDSSSASDGAPSPRSSGHSASAPLSRRPDWVGCGSRSRSSRRSGAARRWSSKGSTSACTAPSSSRTSHEDPDRHRRRRQRDDGAGGGTRRLVERAHRDRGQARCDAPALGRRPLLAPGPGGLRPPGRFPRGRRTGGPQALRAHPCRRHRPPSSSTTSDRSPNAALSGRTCGSVILHNRRRWRASARQSSASWAQRSCAEPRRKRGIRAANTGKKSLEL